MIIKFKDKQAYDKCHTFINGNGFCFRTRGADKMIEFFYEYTMLDVVGFCNGDLDLQDRFEIVK